MTEVRRRTVLGTDDVRTLYEGEGPFVSLYLDARPVTLDGRAASELLERWQVHLDELAIDDEVPDEALDRCREALWVPTDAAGVAIFDDVSAGRTHTFELADPTAHEVAAVGPLPLGTPLLAELQATVTHAVIVGDAEGFDLVVFQRDGEVTESELKRPREDPRAVEQELQREVDAIEGLRLALLVGDARTLAEARIAVAERSDRRVLEIEMAEGEPVPTVADVGDEAVRQAATIAAEDVVEALEELRAGLEAGRAVQGAGATLRVLREGSVDRLLLHDDLDDDRQAWVGSSTTDVSLEPVPDDPRFVAARFGDVVARAALLADADVVIIPTTGPQGPDEGIGAILR